MTWTTDKPTAPGWYWHYQESDDPDYPGHTTIVEVSSNPARGGELCAWLSRTNFYYALADESIFAGDPWQGPIEAPAAPEVPR